VADFLGGSVAVAGDLAELVALFGGQVDHVFFVSHTIIISWTRHYKRSFFESRVTIIRSG
jgi:hypothetical protein